MAFVVFSTQAGLWNSTRFPCVQRRCCQSGDKPSRTLIAAASPPRATNCTNSGSVMRSFAVAAISVLISTSAVLLSPVPQPSLAEILSAPQCVQGEGPGCEPNSEQNPYISKLLEKSRANKDERDKQLLEKYWEQGYGDYFSFGYNKDLVHGEDDKWSLQDPDDLPSTLARKLVDTLKKEPQAPESAEK